MKDPVGFVDVSVLPALLVWNLAATWSGRGVLTHCWALRNHILSPPLVGGVASFAEAGRVLVDGLVGVVVDSWIVDASIL